MNRIRWTAVVLAGVLAACVRTGGGVAVPADGPPETGIATPPATSLPLPRGETTSPGVLPTTRRPLATDAVTCLPAKRPPVAVRATVSDPAAPKITVGIPEGWSVSGGDGDVGARLGGPQDMSATVTIAATPLDPAAAFKRYADDALEQAPVSSVSVLPADLCGYSGQKLLGSWSERPQQAIEFTDRIAHVWTDTGDYLVAVHVQAPSGTDGFDAASSVLMEDFAIVIP